MSIKEIQLTAWEVQALLRGQKSQLRRPVEYGPYDFISPVRADEYGIVGVLGHLKKGGNSLAIAPYIRDDVLCVQEPWCIPYPDAFLYKASTPPETLKKLRVIWGPVHLMPRSAVRIFLRVTDVWVERLQNATMYDFTHLGITQEQIKERGADNELESARCIFKELWDSAVNPKAFEKHRWGANPWTWCIGFERCEKPEGWRW